MVRFLPGADPLKFVMVFSSEVGEWVFSNDFMTINSLRNCLRSVYWDPAFLHGALYVMLPPTHLAQFDFSKETFHMVELPGSEEHLTSSCFGVSRGRLLLCVDMWRWEVESVNSSRYFRWEMDIVTHGFNGGVWVKIGWWSSRRQGEVALWVVLSSGGRSYLFQGWDLGQASSVMKWTWELWMPSTNQNGFLQILRMGSLNIPLALWTFVKRTTFDDVRKNQSARNQWCFKKVGEKWVAFGFCIYRYENRNEYEF